MTQSQVKVCVLMTVYNGSIFLEEQIKSICEQEGVELSIYISVDKSDDDSYEKCYSFKGKTDTYISVLPYGDRFGSPSQNFFRLIRDVDSTQYDYVAFSDQDDIWFKDKIISACLAMKKTASFGYSSNVIAFWETQNKKTIKKSHPQKKFDFMFEAAGPGCSYVLESKKFQEFKEFLINHKVETKEVALHDWLIYAFYRINDYKWFIDPNSKMLYRQHHNNFIGANNGLRAIVNRFKLLKQNWYKNQVLLIGHLISFKSFDLSSRLSILSNIFELRRSRLERFYLFILVLLGFY